MEISFEQLTTSSNLYIKKILQSLKDGLVYGISSKKCLYEMEQFHDFCKSLGLQINMDYSYIVPTDLERSPYISEVVLAYELVDTPENTEFNMQLHIFNERIWYVFYAYPTTSHEEVTNSFEELQEQLRKWAEN